MVNVSVIVPIYNGEPFIRQLLNTLEQQTYTEFKVIFVDDGSEDCSLYSLEESLQNSSLKEWEIVKSEHRGLANARNLGISAANTDFLAFLDCDDLWHPDKLLAQLLFIENSNASAVISRTIGFRQTDFIPQGFNQRSTCSSPLELIESKFIVYGGGSNILVRSEIANMVGTFDTQLPFAEDLDYWLRLLVFGEISEIEEEHVYINMRSTSMQRITSLEVKMQILESLLTIMQKWAYVYPRAVSRKIRSLLVEQIHASLVSRNWGYFIRLIQVIINSKITSPGRIRIFSRFSLFKWILAQTSYTLSRFPSPFLRLTKKFFKLK